MRGSCASGAPHPPGRWGGRGRRAVLPCPAGEARAGGTFGPLPPARTSRAPSPRRRSSSEGRGKTLGRGPGAAPQPWLAWLRGGLLSPFEGRTSGALPGRRVLLQRQISPPTEEQKTQFICLPVRGQGTKSGIQRVPTIAENGPSVLGPDGCAHAAPRPSRAAPPAPSWGCPQLFVFPAPRRREEQPPTEPFGDEECLMVLEGLIQGKR